MLTRRRVLLILGAAVLVSGRVGAQDFAGHRLEHQPTQFLFGYGSLIDTPSREATVGRPTQAVPARLLASFGYVRSWNDRSPTGFTALGLRPAAAGEKGRTVNGVIYPVDGADMSAYDAREQGYVRVKVPLEDLEAVSWQALPSGVDVWVYVPQQDRPPDAAYPLLQSYVDVVMEGALEYGADYAQELILTTEGWSAFWLNDRRLARRPWVYDKFYEAVDRLLSAHVPQFAGRAFPETYARAWSRQPAAAPSSP